MLKRSLTQAVFNNNRIRLVLTNTHQKKISIFDRIGTHKLRAVSVRRVCKVLLAFALLSTANFTFAGTGTWGSTTANVILGIKITQIDGGPCNVYGGQFSQQSYDANGFINSRTDFNSNTAIFINDARGLQISRTEAAGTPEARTITTDWHPTFRLPVKITEPGKITEFTYDANGRLLSRIEHAQ